MNQIINKKKRSRYDWEAIWADYRAGIISIREVARKHGIDHGYLIRKAKSLKVERDLTQKIKQAARAKLVTGKVTTGDAKDIIEQKSDELCKIQVLHRKDIRALRDEEQRLLAELGENPNKLWVGQYQGKVIEHEVGIAVTERSSALQALAGAMHKRIQLERQAYSLDVEPPDDDDLKKKLSPADRKLFKEAARIISQRVIEQAQREHGE